MGKLEYALEKTVPSAANASMFGVLAEVPP
jgi:hypothetical protein